MVLIASCYYQDNYGSKLQAYATQAFLDKCGVENCTINIENINSGLNRKKMKYYLCHTYCMDVFFTQIRRYIFRFGFWGNKALKKNLKVRKGEMEKFVKKMFRLTVPVAFERLRSLCSKQGVSAVVVGSDQLWLPSNIYADYFTLNFVPDNVKKVSYATSFGVSMLDKITEKMAGDFLGRFDYLSVREKDGAVIVHKLTNTSPEIVCDPVMLFDGETWIELLDIKPARGDKYIFCYFLGDNLWHREWAKELRKVTGLKIIALIHLEIYCKADNQYWDEAPFDIDPAGFVSLIENAEYICTDSFHGTVFSLLFHKKFFVFQRFHEKYSASTNTRLDSLLTMLHMTDRVIHKGKKPEDSLSSEINYMKVDKIVSKFRRNSAGWLRLALEVN